MLMKMNPLEMNKPQTYEDHVFIRPFFFLGNSDKNPT